MSAAPTKTKRFTVTFSPDAVEWLQTEARRRATTISDLLRRIVDEIRGAPVVPRGKSDGY